MSMRRSRPLFETHNQSARRQRRRALRGANIRTAFCLTIGREHPKRGAVVRCAKQSELGPGGASARWPAAGAAGEGAQSRAREADTIADVENHVGSHRSRARPIAGNAGAGHVGLSRNAHELRRENSSRSARAGAVTHIRRPHRGRLDIGLVASRTRSAWKARQQTFMGRVRQTRIAARRSTLDAAACGRACLWRPSAATIRRHRVTARRTATIVDRINAEWHQPGGAAACGGERLEPGLARSDRARADRSSTAIRA